MHARNVIGAILMGSILLAGGPRAEESNRESNEHRMLKQGDVPQAVMDAFKKEHKQLQGVEFEQETRDGSPLYGMEWKSGGKEEEVFYDADGTLVERHEQINLRSVPAPVRAAVMRDHPKATIAEAEKVMDGGRKLIGYEVDVREGHKTTELVYDSGGKLIRRETI